MKSFLKHKKKISKKNVEESPARITNETVAEHREKVLAGGRKFKYPVQYQKHKLVVNSIIIAVVAIVLLTILGWYQLYVAQNNSQLMYRITQIIPVSVASVDGEPVRYSDYLMRSHSVIFYMQKMDLINLGSDNGKCQEAYYKRQELTNTEKNTYVNKLARELKLNVSDKEVDDFIKKDIDARAVSLNAYEKTVLNSYYDWSLDEYKSVVKNELLKRKVSFSVDNDAKARATSILNEVKAGGDFATIATLHSDDDNTKANGGDSGVLPISSLDSSGLISAAINMEVNQISELINGVDGYYIIQLVSKDSATVRYRSIKVSLKVFEQRFAALKEAGKIKEYINIDREGCLDQG